MRSAFMLIIAGVSSILTVSLFFVMTVLNPWLMLTWIPAALILWLIHVSREHKRAPGRRQHAAQSRAWLAECQARRADLEAARADIRARGELNRRRMMDRYSGIVPQDLEIPSAKH